MLELENAVEDDASEPIPEGLNLSTTLDSNANIKLSYLPPMCFQKGCHSFLDV